MVNSLSTYFEQRSSDAHTQRERPPLGSTASPAGSRVALSQKHARSCAEAPTKKLFIQTPVIIAELSGDTDATRRWHHFIIIIIIISQVLFIVTLSC